MALRSLASRVWRSRAEVIGVARLELLYLLGFAITVALGVR
jgi:hypothetical protein